MKLLFASDIHGSYDSCEKLSEIYEKGNFNKLILIGDILYHGPRNDLPCGYAPKKVAALLNEMASEIICVRGNCDAEVDQMMLSFPCLSDYTLIFTPEEKTIFCTHGHLYDKTSYDKMKRGDIIAEGHTHLYALENRGTYIYLNTGSVSLPKGENVKTYATYEDGNLFVKDFLTGENLLTLKS